MDASRHDVATEGWQPVWSPRGGELFYREWNGTAMMAVTVRTEPTFQAGVPEMLFSHGRFDQDDRVRQWDVGPDGDRFLMLNSAGADEEAGSPPTQIIFVDDWFEELKRLVPTE